MACGVVVSGGEGVQRKVVVGKATFFLHVAALFNFLGCAHFSFKRRSSGEKPYLTCRLQKRKDLKLGDKLSPRVQDVLLAHAAFESYI